MGDIPEQVRHYMIRDDLLTSFKATLEERVNRYLKLSSNQSSPIAISRRLRLNASFFMQTDISSVL